jgi:Ca-activated chloride channel homolog
MTLIFKEGIIMKKLNNMVFVSLMCVGLIACNDSSSTKSQGSTSTSAPTTSNVQNSQRVEFRYTWLENQDANAISEEDMFDTNYYFIVDGSGSMDSSSCEGGGKKIDVAKQAISKYVSTLSNDVNVGLLAFDRTGIAERVGLSKNNKAQFDKALFEVQANNSTPLASSIKMAYEKVKNQASKQGSHGEYNIIIVTDGEADGGENPSDIVKEIGLNSPVNITTIGFCINNSHSLNNPEYVHYYPAGSYQSILDGLSTVQAEGEGVSDEEYIQNLDYLASM